MNQFAPPLWQEFRNEAGEEIPAYGILRLDGYVTLPSGRIVLAAKKPNTYGSQYLHAVNGPQKIAPQKTGICLIPTSVPGWALFASGSPQPGERWGPISGSWELKQHVGGFRIVGESNATRVLVVQAAIMTLLGKPDAEIAAGTSGTVSVFHGTTAGSETDSGQNITAYNRSNVDIPETTWVHASWISEGWEIHWANVCS